MYIILEMLGGVHYAFICTDEDGNNIVFDNIKEAEEYAENCQDPLIVKVKE